MTYTIEIPNWHPPKSNQFVGRHWSVKNRLRKLAIDMIFVYARQAKVAEATGQRKVSLKITMGPRGRVPDADAYDKLLLDALTKCRLITDDGRSGVLGRVAVEFVRGKAPATTIVLEDVP